MGANGAQSRQLWWSCNQGANHMQHDGVVIATGWSGDCDMIVNHMQHDRVVNACDGKVLWLHVFWDGTVHGSMAGQLVNVHLCTRGNVTCRHVRGV